jgi:hypothetical protein
VPSLEVAYVWHPSKFTREAAITMLRLMTDQSVPPAVRFRAAEAIVDLGLKGVEVEDIEARLSQLEAAAEENNKSGKGR